MSDLYREAFERAILVLKTARKRHPLGVAAWLGERLLHVPRERRQIVLQNSTRYRTPEVCSWLVEHSDGLRFEDPVAMIEAASLAVQVAEALGDEPTPAVAADHRAEARASLANAQRVLGDLHAAEESFGTAADHLLNGSGDPLVSARFARLKGGLEVDRHNFDEALKLYLGAFRTYMDLGEHHRAGRTLVRMAIALTYADKPEEAMECLHLSLRLVDVRVEPGIVISAAHSMAYLYAQEGEAATARRLIRVTYPLYRAVPGRVALVRLAWMEGRVLVACGLLAEAEIRLAAVRDDFHRRGMAFDAALAGLDLAGVYLQTGQLAKVATLAQEMHAVFSSQGLGDRAAAALLLLATAAREQRLTQEVITQAVARVKEARRERLGRS